MINLMQVLIRRTLFSIITLTMVALALEHFVFQNYDDYVPHHQVYLAILCPFLMLLWCAFFQKSEKILAGVGIGILIVFTFTIVLVSIF